MKRGLLAAGVAGAAALAWLAFRAGQDPVPAPPSVRQAGPGHWIVSAAERDRYLGAPDQVGRDVRLRPTPGADPKRVEDLRVDLVAPGSPLGLAGLGKGDRILSLNGSPVTTLERAVNLVHEIRRSPRLLVETERDGRRIDYRVDCE